MIRYCTTVNMSDFAQIEKGAHGCTCVCKYLTIQKLTMYRQLTCVYVRFLHGRNGYSTNGARYGVRVTTVVYMKSSTRKVVSNSVQASRYYYIFTISMVTVLNGISSNSGRILIYCPALSLLSWPREQSMLTVYMHYICCSCNIAK